MRVTLLFTLCLACGTIRAQDINIYSEFQRFDPFGNVVPQDHEPQQREILSPAVPRNGHLSVHVVVNAPPGTNYFIYDGQSPSDILRVKIYREHYRPCGDDYCPDYLTEQHSPSFGAMPESVHDLPNQNTRCYLFDIYVPPDVPPRRVRIEALLKVGIWMVAPMEVRVISPTVPDSRALPAAEDIASVDAPSYATAQRQLLRFVNGEQPEMPPGILRVRDIIQRNAAEDMLVAQTLGIRGPELKFMAWTPFTFPQTGGEWYLHARDFIYRSEPDWRRHGR
ncbi:MAG: hypothetical protein KGN84_15075 [Acidobacteriota bacterium]|nr:hypothetical protein [Acidobacteriota bacterium]